MLVSTTPLPADIYQCPDCRGYYAAHPLRAGRLVYSWCPICRAVKRHPAIELPAPTIPAWMTPASRLLSALLWLLQRRGRHL